MEWLSLIEASRGIKTERYQTNRENLEGKSKHPKTLAVSIRRVTVSRSTLEFVQKNLPFKIDQRPKDESARSLLLTVRAREVVNMPQ